MRRDLLHPSPIGRLLLVVLFALGACTLASGCSTGHPPPISASELAQAETFPYYPVYWVGRDFVHVPLTAADGQRTYNSAIGDSVYYGDCVRGSGILQTGSCRLPLQVTTVIYQLHPNSNLGAQRNTLLRGVPATIYEGGRAIELYSGRLAIDIFSNSPARALLASSQLHPLNAPGSSSDPLPAPVFCPGLSGEIPPAVNHVLLGLRGHVCQLAEAADAQADSRGD
ncbi:MAG TPA: hypothetical protein VGF15_07655 [Solirubrobacteraceae bacterium]